MKLTDFKALSFDCYGTLIDWESGMLEALKPLTSKVARKLTRGEILQAHARHESAQQIQTPAKLYRDLLPIVYRRLAEEWAVPVSWSECATYGRSIRNWPAFPDSADALKYLKRHYKFIILSNVDNESFSASNEKLQVDFDAIYTAEDIGSYKPSSRNCNARGGEGPAPAYRREPVPRSWAGERARPRLLLDLSTTRPGRFRRDHDPRRNAEMRFPVQ
jgi:2-haloacid dehalogenase